MKNNCAVSNVTAHRYAHARIRAKHASTVGMILGMVKMRINPKLKMYSIYFWMCIGIIILAFGNLPKIVYALWLCGLMVLAIIPEKKDDEK